MKFSFLFNGGIWSGSSWAYISFNLSCFSLYVWKRWGTGFTLLFPAACVFHSCDFVGGFEDLWLCYPTSLWGKATNFHVYTEHSLTSDSAGENHPNSRPLGPPQKKPFKLSEFVACQGLRYWQAKCLSHLPCLQRIWAQLSHSERQTCGFLSLSMCIHMVCFNSLTSRCHSWTWLDNCIWQVFIKGTCFFFTANWRLFWFTCNWSWERPNIHLIHFDWPGIPLCFWYRLGAGSNARDGYLMNPKWPKFSRCETTGVSLCQQGDWYETFDRCDRLFCRRRWMCVLLHPWIRLQPGFRSSDLERFRKTSEHFWTTKYALALSRIHFKSLRVGSIDDWFEVHCLMSRYLCTYPSTTCANLAGLCSDLQTQVKMDTYYKINGNFRILKWRYCTI